MHIACFISVCECFLAIEPHFDLWRKYFEVKLQTNVHKTCECGRAAICRRSNSKCLKGEFVEMNKKWQDNWFYMPDV